ncbi:hypothetical protein [Acidiferrobacter sp.]|jgi:hypothetical protein|nr:hypothetical protein [Acidiferrobacter sp.]
MPRRRTHGLDPRTIEVVMATHKHFSSPPLPEPLFYELAATLEFDRFF